MPAPTGRDDATAVDTSRPPLAPASRTAHLAAIAALLAGLGYLTWRWGFTVQGADLWLAVPLLVAETYGLVMLLLLTFSCWRLAARPVPDPLPGRSVAVLVATYDEDEDVLRPTVVGARAIRNDVPPEVWVLDDGDRPWVREMCDELGVRYLVAAHVVPGSVEVHFEFSENFEHWDPVAPVPEASLVGLVGSAREMEVVLPGVTTATGFVRMTARLVGLGGE